MRTTLAVDEKVAKNFSEIVKKKNMVIYSVTNEAINLAIELLKEDIEPDEALTFIKLMKIMDSIDVIPLPGYLNEEILNKLYSVEKDALYDTFLKTGKEVAAVFKAFMPNLIDIIKLARSLIKFFPLKKIEVEELGSKYRLLVAGAGKSPVTTNCVLYFLRGFLDGYDAKILEEKVSTGVIDVIFVKK
ncbi:MAG TPA: hypothetical protein VKU94_02535 [Geobacterales bacterium]|nr:hypothetical protein [Geobacterales bacterium]